MMQIPRSFNQRRLLHGATTMIVIGLTGTVARGQVPSTTTPSGIRPDAGTQGPSTQNADTSGNSESITVRPQRRLMREKYAPSVVTVLAAARITQTRGDAATRRTVGYVDQQGIGNNEPVLTVRGC